MQLKGVERRPFSYNRSMELNTVINEFRDWLNAITHSDWFGTATTIIIITVVCAVVAHITTIMLRKLLKSDKGPLPSVSIFVNIARVTIWIIGLSVVLSSCFNVNIGAAVTALGIGGIAISLGFQGTLSNLIGGLQIIIIGLVEPGDRISVGNYKGVVHDVTWRHTTITTTRNEHVIIPNSVINSEALVKLPPEIDVKLEITIKPNDDEDIGTLLTNMEEAIKEALSKESIILKKPKIRLIGMDHTGYKAQVTFAVEEGKEESYVIDVAMKAIDTVKSQKSA